MFSKLLKSVDPIYGNPQASHSATCDVIAGKYCEMFMFTLRFVSLCCFSSRSTVEFSYLSSSLSLSQCQWVAVRSAAVTITFLVVAKRSIGCRRTHLCVSSGFYAYLELTGPLLRPVSCVPTISRRTVLSTQQFRAFTRVVDWSQMLFRLCFTSRRCHKTDVVGRDMLTLTVRRPQVVQYAPLIVSIAVVRRTRRSWIHCQSVCQRLVHVCHQRPSWPNRQQKAFILLFIAEHFVIWRLLLLFINS